MGRVSITETGATEFEGRLLALEDNLMRLPIVAAEVFEGLEQYYDKTWAKGDPPNTEATAERWPDTSPLYNTGILKESLTRSESAGAVRAITPFGFEFGTKIFYAKFLQHGTRKMRPHPPMRGLRSTRALVGYLVRKSMYRGVFPAEEIQPSANL